MCVGQLCATAANPPTYGAPCTAGSLFTPTSTDWFSASFLEGLHTLCCVCFCNTLHNKNMGWQGGEGTKGSASPRWGEAHTSMHRLASVQDLIQRTVIRKGKKYIFKRFFLTVRSGRKKDALLRRQSADKKFKKSSGGFISAQLRQHACFPPHFKKKAGIVQLLGPPGSQNH